MKELSFRGAVSDEAISGQRLGCRGPVELAITEYRTQREARDNSAPLSNMVFRSTFMDAQSTIHS